MGDTDQFVEHLEDEDELLLHPFVAALRQMCEKAWMTREHDLRAPLLACLDRGLDAGNERLTNAIAVSFVEDSEQWPTTFLQVSAEPTGRLELPTARLQGAQQVPE